MFSIVIQQRIEDDCSGNGALWRGVSKIFLISKQIVLNKQPWNVMKTFNSAYRMFILRYTKI